MIRVALVGAESTGKTTLAKRLALHYATAWVPEYGRMYTEQRDDGPWSTAEFEHIARVQMWIEDSNANVANRILFCDTDIMTTALFHELYLGRRSASLEQWGRERLYDLYFLLDIPGFVQDGFRHDEQAQRWMQSRLIEELGRRSEPVVKLAGSNAVRTNLAIRAITRLFPDVYVHMRTA